MTGFYGKLPAKGDFLSRNLSRGFTDAWDNWLQTGMNDSRQTLGDGWLQTYLTSPLWRFALPAGTCGSNACAGVLMPSMDRVGRYFPMAVVNTLPADISPVMFVALSGSWFQSVEDELLAALENEAIDLDSFDNSLQTLDRVVPKSPATVAPVGLQHGVHIALDEAANVPMALLGMAGNAVTQAVGNSGVWYTLGSDLVAPCMLFCEGLPAQGRYTAMLDGNWSLHGWAAAGNVASGITPTVIDVASL